MLLTVPISAFYTGLFGLLLIGLAARIPILRRRHHVGIGHGGEDTLAKLIRVHGNFTEYVPTALLLLLVNELNGAADWLLHGAGILLIVGRLLHAFGLSSSKGYSFGRFWGTALTWTVIVLLSLEALYIILFAA